MYENNMPQQQNGQNQQHQRPSISTNVATFWDENGTQMRVSYLENGVSLAFWLPQITETGSRKYPPEMRYSTIISLRILTGLMAFVMDDLMPAYESAKPHATCAVFTNKARTSIIQLEMENGQFFIKFHQNVDPNTNMPQRTISFKFDTYPIMSNYSSASGEINAEAVQVDFYLFIKMLKTYVDNAGGLCAGHGSNTAMNYHFRKMMDYMIGIANAVHAQLPAPSYNSYNRQNNQGMTNYSQNPEVPSNNLPSPAMQDVDNLSDLIG